MTFPELKPLTMPVTSPFKLDLGDPLLPELKPQPPTQPAKKRKESSGPKARPAFVMKIWSMVNDKSNDEYIRWNEDGKTFQVFKREDFVHKILPAYFKHQNMSSFVRQLNMYGFHKVQDITNGTLYPNGDKSGGDEVWQFENPNFIRGREDLLDNIVRNKSVAQEESQQLTDTHSFANGDLSLILSELSQIKQNQARLNEEILRIRQDNQNMYNANYINRKGLSNKVAQSTRFSNSLLLYTMTLQSRDKHHQLKMVNILIYHTVVVVNQKRVKILHINPHHLFPQTNVDHKILKQNSLSEGRGCCLQTGQIQLSPILHHL